MNSFDKAARVAVPAFLVTAVLCGCAFADWQYNGNPLCTASGSQYDPQIISDCARGAIVTWTDYRSDTGDIYAQRVGASGAVEWARHGVALCAASGDQHNPRIMSDGIGGAIATWEDCRRGSNYDIYVQRIGVSGDVEWAQDGVALCTAAGDQHDPAITSDGEGGAIVAWEDHRRGSNYDIYVQRVSASGVPQWTSEGVALCTAATSQYSPEITSDGEGGAIVAWSDLRNGSWDVYAQRISASGIPLWAADGIALSATAADQYNPRMTSDGEGGAILTWTDYPGHGVSVHAQRVSASGVVQWVAGGVALCTAGGDQLNHKITSDGVGGAIVAWQDHRVATPQVYAQRVSPSGVVQWPPDGVALSNSSGGAVYPTITFDGVGGAIVAWEEYLSGNNYDIYAQGVNAAGAVEWERNGVALCTATNVQYAPEITSDGVGGAIIAWHDYRSGSHYDVYAQRVPAGIEDVTYTPTSNTALDQNFPNPFNPLTAIKFSVATPGNVTLRIHDTAGRVVRTLVDAWREPGVYNEVWDGKGDDGSVLPSGVYFYTLRTQEFVATHKMVLLK